MNEQTLKQKVVKGALWTMLERLGVQAVSFVVGMILARLLSPDDYGTVALTTIFFSVAGVLVDGGFGGALVQKKDADDLDFNSVFYLNMAFSLAAYLIFFIAAPAIARFYNVPLLTALVRISALGFIFNAVNAIQNAELTKKMLFHLSFRISVITCISSAIVGLVLAFSGYGVWSIVGASLVSNFVGVTAKWFIIAWRPKLMFSFSRLRPLFSYGWKMAASALLDQVFSNLNGLLIGKFYSRADLAFVNKGDATPRLIMDQVDGTLGRVTFPALVMMQNDIEKMREAMRKMIQFSTFLTFPLMTGLCMCAHSLLLLLYGEQWVPATPYMMVACFSFALLPFHTINLRGIMAVGRSDIFLKLEIVKKVAKIVVILISLRHGVFVFVAVSAFALGPLSVLINAWPNRRLLNYTIGMQLRDVWPSARASLFMGGVVYTVSFFYHAFCPEHLVANPIMLVALLLVQFFVGSATYATISYVARISPMGEFLRIISQMTGFDFSIMTRRFRHGA